MKIPHFCHFFAKPSVLTRNNPLLIVVIESTLCIHSFVVNSNCILDFFFRSKERILNNFSNKTELLVLTNKIKSLIANSAIDFDQLLRFPMKFFNVDVKTIMQNLKSMSGSEDNLHECENDEDCLEQEAIATLTYKMSHQKGKGNDQLFGSFLRNFGSKFLDNFNSEKKLSFFCMALFGGCKKDFCKTFHPSELVLHEYFANLSMKVGFKEKVSLFDIPSLLSYNFNLYIW